MDKLNKRFLWGFIAGFVCFPVLLVGAGIIYYQIMFGSNFETPALSPPDIPKAHAVNLNWEVESLDGEKINIEKEFGGKILFVNFWATWCTPCLKEIPSIIELYDKYKNHIVFLCISNEDTQTIKAYLEKSNQDFPVYRQTGNLPSDFYAQGIPATFVISKDRKILLKHIGSANWAHEDVIAFLDDLLIKG